jgi:hypothetical protein
VNFARAQRFSSPRRQRAQVPQVQPSHGTTDARAGVHFDAGADGHDLADDLVTGDDRMADTGRSPSITCRSVRQTAQALTLMSTWPTAGVGSARRSSSSGGAPRAAP